jgi:hypothetical protein
MVGYKTGDPSGGGRAQAAPDLAELTKETQ